MISDQKKDKEKRKMKKKYIHSDTGTSSADDSYFSSSLASSSDESDDGETVSKSRNYSKSGRKKRSYKYTPPKKLGSRESNDFDKYDNDDEFDHTLYRSNGKLSLQTISSLNNSRTILNALQSLQNKIQSLEEERDRYRKEAESRDRERSTDRDKRKEDRLRFLQDKEEIMKERNNLSEQLIQSQEKVTQLETQLSQFENHTSSVREDLRDAQVKLRDKDDRNMELSRKIIELETEVERERGREEQQSRKIEELSRFVVKERRKIERLEEQNDRLNASIQNLVDLGKIKGGKRKAKKGKRVFTSSSSGKNKNEKQKPNHHHIIDQVNPKTLVWASSTNKYQNLPSTIKKRTQKKKKKKKKSKYIINNNNNNNNNTSKTTKKGKKRKGTGISTRFVTSSKRKSMKGGGGRWSPGKGNLKDRLFRANLRRDVPFIAGGNAKSSFNTNSLAQTGLNMGISDKKKISSIEKDDSTILRPNGEIVSDTTSTISTDPSCGLLSDEVGRDHAESVLTDIKKEYDSLSLEYHGLLGKIKTGEEVKVTQKLKAVGELMKRKERQLQKLRSYRNVVNSSSHLNRPRIRGAKKRVKTLKLFRNLKKIVNT